MHERRENSPLGDDWTLGPAASFVVERFFGNKRNAERPARERPRRPSAPAPKSRPRGADARATGDVSSMPPPGGLRAIPFTFAGQRIAVLSFPIPELRFPSELTTVERQIARLLVQGRSPDTIARARKRSTFTVVNQIRSIYGKLGVHSLAQLVDRLVGTGTENDG